MRLLPVPTLAALPMRCACREVAAKGQSSTICRSGDRSCASRSSASGERIIPLVLLSLLLQLLPSLLPRVSIQCGRVPWVRFQVQGCGSSGLVLGLELEQHQSLHKNVAFRG